MEVLTMIDLFVGFFVLILAEIFSKKPNSVNCRNHIVPFIFHDELDKKNYLDNSDDGGTFGDEPFYILES